MVTQLQQNMLNLDRFDTVLCCTIHRREDTVFKGKIETANLC